MKLYFCLARAVDAHYIYVDWSDTVVDNEYVLPDWALYKDGDE